MTGVVVIHDASIDEYMSVVLLAGMEEIDLAGTVIVNADCIAGPAMQVAWRIQHAIGRGDLPLSLSRARGLNPFPWEYRSDCIALGGIPGLQSWPPNETWPPYPDGDQWLQDFFAQLDGQVTVLCLCPLTPLATLLDALPEAADKIERLVWMGGAIDVAGNLDPTTVPPAVANPYAEWNVFWDPPAVAQIFAKTKFPITLFPLDITDQAKVSPEFMAALLLAGKRWPVANLACQGYALVGKEPFYDLWDVTTTVWLAQPGLYTAPKTVTLSVVTTDDRQGALIENPSGRRVDAVTSFADLHGFYSYVEGQLQR